MWDTGVPVVWSSAPMVTLKLPAPLAFALDPSAVFWLASPLALAASPSAVLILPVPLALEIRPVVVLKLLSPFASAPRPEEHTSELHSHLTPVCPLPPLQQTAPRPPAASPPAVLC